MTERLSLGIDELDEHLKGGPRPGTVICLTAPPASQARSLLYAFMNERPTIYITTVRREDGVRDELEYVLGSDVEFSIKPTGTANPIRSVNEILEKTDIGHDDGEQANVIVDTMNPLERSGKRTRHIALLNALKSYLLRTDGVAMLYCTEMETPPPLREVTLTVADLVMNLEVVSAKNAIENRLTIPKFRSRDVVEEVIKLKLGQEALVDTSRNL